MNSIQQNRKQFFSAFLFAILFVFSTSINLAQEFEDEEEYTNGKEPTNAEKIAEDPIKLFYEAQAAHAKGELDTALKLYDRAIKANPEFPEAEFQRGSIFINFGNVKEAEKAFRRAIELRRDWTLPIAELGALLVQNGDYREAETYLNQAIRLNAMSFPAYVALTELKIRTDASPEDLRLHLGKLQYLTTKAKIPASIWASRAAIERKLNDKDSAKISIIRALSIDENNSFALRESIEMSLIDRDTKGAIKNARNLLQLYPNSINAKLLLAQSLHLDGDSSEALEILDAIEAPRPDVIELKTAIALNGTNSIAALQELLKKDENSVKVLGRLCILSRLEQAEKALEYCERASKLEPTEINHAIGYGAALVKLKRHEIAVNLFKKLLVSSPDNYTIRANMAIALFELKRFEEAKQEYIWITKKQPKLAAAYYFLAISHDRLTEYLDAMANYQKFMNLADQTLELEMEKVNLRLPILQRQIKQGKGKKRR